MSMIYINDMYRDIIMTFWCKKYYDIYQHKYQNFFTIYDNDKPGEREGLNELALQKIIQANDWELGNDSEND